MASLPYIYSLGYAWGQALGGFHGAPVIGVPVNTAFRSLVIQEINSDTPSSLEEAKQAFFVICRQHDRESRDRPPFQSVKRLISESKNRDEAWKSFDSGMIDALDKYWESIGCRVAAGSVSPPSQDGGNKPKPPSA